MTSHTLKKSSFSLSKEEIPLVIRLKKKLRLKSNTEVVRRALQLLESHVERTALRTRFQEASSLVRKANAEDYEELDLLAEEGLE